MVAGTVDASNAGGVASLCEALHEARTTASNTVPLQACFWGAKTAPSWLTRGARGCLTSGHRGIGFDHTELSSARLAHVIHRRSASAHADYRCPMGPGEPATFLGALTERERDALLTAGRRRKFATGAHIIRQGDNGSSVFVIQRGQAKVTSVTLTGLEAVCAVESAGSL